MKSTSEEGSNKGTHDEKMEAGDRETLMRKEKKKDWRLKGCRRKNKEMDVRETILQIYIYSIGNTVGHHGKEGGQKDKL